MKSQKFPKSQMLASVQVDKGRMFLLFPGGHSGVSLFLKASKAFLTSLRPCFNDGVVVTVCALLNAHCCLTRGSNACTREVLENRCKRSNNPPANISSAQIKQATESAESRRSSKAAAGRVPAPSLRDSLASNRTLPLAKALIRGAVL